MKQYSIAEEIDSISKILTTGHRVKLSEKVFEDRHLPTIKKNGKPTPEMQEELVKLSGGETKVIDIVNESGDVVISLPAAIPSTINDPTISSILSDVNESDLEASKSKINRDLGKKGKIMVNTITDRYNAWKDVINHYSKNSTSDKKIDKQNNNDIEIEY